MALVPYTEKIFVSSGLEEGKRTAAKENLMSALGGGRSSQMNKKQKTRLVSATIFRVARLRTKKELKSLR